MQKVREQFSEVALVLHVAPCGEDKAVYTLFTHNKGLLRGISNSVGFQRTAAGMRVFVRAQRAHSSALWRVDFERLSPVWVWGSQTSHTQEWLRILSYLIRFLPPGHAYPALHEGIDVLRGPFPDNKLQAWAFVWFNMLLLRTLGYGMFLKPPAFTVSHAQSFLKTRVLLCCKTGTVLKTFTNTDPHNKRVPPVLSSGAPKSIVAPALLGYLNQPWPACRDILYVCFSCDVPSLLLLALSDAKGVTQFFIDHFLCATNARD